MGAALGLLLGIGAFLIFWSLQPDRPARTPQRRPRRRLVERVEDLLLQAGIESVSPRGLIGSCVAVGLTALVLVTSISRTPVIGLAFGLIASAVPVTLVRRRARQRRDELRALWPEAVDNLASAVRAGLSLPEALAQLGVRGPAPLRRPFQRFAEDYRVSGRFYDCLDRLKAQLADPVGDRIVESLRMAREVGGSDLGRLLRTLSTFLREDVRTRGELETRQGWTVNAARLAVAAPWAMLLLLSLRTDAVRAYNSPTGVLVLAIGGGVSLLAYRLMVRIGRLPEERRVLR